MSDRCHCIVCNREFDYGDKWSPMVKDSIWDFVIRKYDLVDIEASNEVLFNYYYDLYELNQGSQYGDECFEKCGDYSTFICYPCMEKALGRELTYDDLYGKNIPLNAQFEKKVLSQREK